MLLLLLVLVVIPSVLSLPYCDDSGRTHTFASCSSLSLSICAQRYSWVYQQDTAEYSASPKTCVVSGSNCVASLTCEPPCGLRKTGGPDGYLCSNFYVQSNCAQWYADNGGDKWCFWSILLGACYDGLTCHN